MILQGDCLETLKTLADNSIDAVVTDPPAGISFMNKVWDDDKGGRKQWIAWLTEVMVEVRRVLKPGGHGLVWALPRTSHWTATALEDAGFEVRDCLTHIFGSGFPKSMDVSKAIDKAAGAEREILGYGCASEAGSVQRKPRATMPGGKGQRATIATITAPATPDAKRWSGWGTALKPASEHWWLVRKPLEGTVAANVLKHGTGALNIDASRIANQNGEIPKGSGNANKNSIYSQVSNSKGNGGNESLNGRWPANVLFDEEAAAVLDAQSGVSKSPEHVMSGGKSTFQATGRAQQLKPCFGDSGGASRFFYVAKSSKRERNAGLDKFGVFKVETSLCEDGNTALVALLQRVTSESTAKWLIGESGKSISVQFPMDSKSIIETKIKQTIESKILSSLIRSLTSGSTRDASSSKANGSSRAESAESLKRSLLSTTNGKTELALGVAHAAFETLQKISESVAQPASNFHSTVKPIKLMQYLIRLVTPPGGTVLDPFMGSGTTGCAARSMGFKFIGCELSPEYVEIAKKRIKHHEVSA